MSQLYFCSAAFRSVQICGASLVPWVDGNEVAGVVIQNFTARKPRDLMVVGRLQLSIWDVFFQGLCSVKES